MKREELIAYDKWLTRRKWGTGEIISPEKAADLYLAEHPLPPAGGAEETAQRCPVCGGNGLVTNGFYNQTSGYWSTSSISPETCRTCNGTGVILPSYLHAQKIADKMVEERIILDEEMAEPVQDALYATGRFTIDECNVLTEGILMYIKERGIINLKSREK